MPRTSQTHPLKIDSLPVANGTLGLTLAPGKRCTSLTGPDWTRDLDTDLDAIKDWGADLVMTLTTTSEMKAMKIGGLGKGVRARGIDWLHLPFEDCSTPDEDWWALWRKQSFRIHLVLEQGGRVVLHCRAGLERTAMVAALILMERGVRVPEALAQITEVRPGAGPLKPQLAKLILNAPAGRGMGPRIRASLLGGAIGDAMGAEIEFWSLSRIRRRFGDAPVTALPYDGKLGAITDDTQMTLFTAEGLIRAARRSALKGICHPPSVVHHALLRWYATQEGQPQVDWIDRDAGLILDPRLHALRAPGNTCLSALGAATCFGETAENTSKGCGTIMRMAPVAFLGGRDPHRLARECSDLTHGHPTAADAAAAFVDILIDLQTGLGVEDAARRAAAHTGAETSRAIEVALTASADGRPETVETLGGGWVAEEALSIALYAARVARSFEEGIAIAVTHSGDSDSTGAIAGNILGLIFSDEVSHHPLAERIECADRIVWIADDLSQVGDPCSHLPDDFDIRYPGC